MFTNGNLPLGECVGRRPAADPPGLFPRPGEVMLSSDAARTDLSQMPVLTPSGDYPQSWS